MGARAKLTTNLVLGVNLKDVDLMLDSSRSTGQRLPLSETHAALMRAAVAAGDGDLDNAAILRQLRRERHKDRG